jgi:hypothetical protein
MEDEIRRCTAYVIRRNCHFAGLGIIVIAMTRVDDPSLALDVAGILNFIMAAALLLAALNAPSRDYRRSEVLALLKEKGRTPPALAAQKLLSTARRDACIHFARYAGAAAAFFLAMGIMWAVIHPTSGQAGVDWSLTDISYSPTHPPGAGSAR